MNDYHDYVIKDGAFIGAFEEMYRDCDDPWGQSSDEYNSLCFSKMGSIQFMKKFNVQTAVEFGCGFGYYTSMIYKNSDINILGVDISKTAIEKARKLWNPKGRLSFKVDNVKNIANYSDYDCVIFSEIGWYILEDFKDIINLMHKNLKGKIFINNLVFYKDSLQKYGVNYFTNLDEYIKFVPFELLGYLEATTVGESVFETTSVFRI